MLVNADSPIERKMERLTFENLARLIDLIPRLIHIRIAEVAMRRVADFNTAASRQKIVGATEPVPI